MVNKPTKEINRITRSIHLTQMKVEKKRRERSNNIMCLNLAVPFPLNILDLNTPIKRQKFRMG